MIKSMILAVGVMIYLVSAKLTKIEQMFQLPIIHRSSAHTQAPIFEEVAPLKISNKEKECLAQNVYFEAGTEEILGKIAVAQVTLNRVKVGHWGRSICQVVHAPDQFSWTNDQDRLDSNPKGELWRESLLAVNTVIDNGIRIRQLNKALFYHAEYVNPFWRDANKMIGQIGTHIFYWGGKDSWVEL